MKSKTIRLAVGACVVLAVAAVYLAVSFVSPAVYLTVIFSGLLFTILTSTYFIVTRVVQSSRRHIRASADLHKMTHLRLQNLEASRARAAVKMQKTLSLTAAGIGRTDRALSDSEAARARAAKKANDQINSLLRALSDSEAARARAAKKTNDQINVVLSELRHLGAAAEGLERLGTASRELLVEREKSRSQLVESFTTHAVQVEMYLTEIQESLAHPVPSYKEEVLGRLLHRAG
ncbi:hypothetical protein [Pseudarthrobacter raffinosi]|uniref:hypothetical protein n=1 Tax=Pseudarthrobacter raffinosi TaxID=2953651 RepID=UPI00208F9121|nr:hypothetical protein [Pseudarthrobacter sp. MDT3-28]MCO4238785.1 hypothetical protein [Pseudarthrobacter sp. MDT3-28]